MPDRDAARPTSPSDAFRVPDQLQQARRPAAPERPAKLDRPDEPRGAPQRTGILGQLEIERGHDR